MEAIRSSETSVHTRSTQRHIPEDGILQRSSGLLNIVVMQHSDPILSIIFLSVDSHYQKAVRCNYEISHQCLILIHVKFCTTSLGVYMWWIVPNFTCLLTVVISSAMKKKVDMDLAPMFTDVFKEVL
jgi:hypothetical protein